MADGQVVFDAEPLIAYYWDEPGAGRVDDHLEDVERGRVRGAINAVTCTEVHYVVARDDPARADAYLERIRNWFTVVDADPVWERAAYFKREYGVALGDAFTVATADHRGATAICGADDDFDDVTEVDVERFREEGV